MNKEDDFFVEYYKYIVKGVDFIIRSPRYKGLQFQRIKTTSDNKI